MWGGGGGVCVCVCACVCEAIIFADQKIFIEVEIRKLTLLFAVIINT